MNTRVIEDRSSSGRTQIVHSIYGAPTSGTYADYWMLKDYYRQQDEEWMDAYAEKWTVLKFNTAFLKAMKTLHGELHCEFCGKKHLIIYAWNDAKKNINLMATTDHFIPKSLDRGRLTYDISNLLVACNKCNNQKKSAIWDRSRIRFEYPNKKTDFGQLKKLVESNLIIENRLHKQQPNLVF